MLLIYASSVTNRLKYIAGLMVRDLLGLEVDFTISREEFRSYSGPKIWYAKEPSGEGLSIDPVELLFEPGFHIFEVTSSRWNNMPVLFPSPDTAAEIPFDPFAAAFYLVSRYEEYSPHKKDGYGRYPVRESIAWKDGFLELPVVHLWTSVLKDSLGRHYPRLAFREPRYRFVPTIDVDHAWAYKGRTWSRSLGGLARSLMHFHPGDAINRLQVLAGMAPDPFDTYEFIKNVHEPHGNHPLYFILFADYGGNDNNVTVTSKPFHRLLSLLDAQGRVGIHPSLSSGRDMARMEEEYFGLCDVLDRKVTVSRQHFLKYTLPRTYRSLIQLGITDDYSMGYASHPGYRAGIAVPFRFFDLPRNEVTSLTIHPVSIMDVTLRDYLRLNAVESLERIQNTIREIKAVNGEFVSLWHNESLGDSGRWKGWQDVYREMVKLATT